MKLIKLKDKFILVSDENIKESNAYLTSKNTICKCLRVDDKYVYSIEAGSSIKKDCKKIIAGIPELPSIDFSLLSEEDCKTIGWVDVEKLADLWSIDTNNVHPADSYIAKQGYLEGFKTAQSLNDKMFSLEDMRKAYEDGFYTRGTDSPLEDFSVYASTELQQTNWDVKVEMEVIGHLHDMSKPIDFDKPVKKPKIIEGKIKVTKIL